MNNGQWSGGKGSKPRKVNKKAYDAAYDNIFKKDKPIEDKLPEEIRNDLNAVQGVIFVMLTCVIYWILFWFMLHLFNFNFK